jgi:hypothetical protein
VKVRGTVGKDDFIAPSGRNDGTAVAVRNRPVASVGFAYQVGTDDENEVDQKGSDYTTSLLKKKRTGCCCCSSVGRCQKRRAWHLVTVYVFSPAETVNDGKTRSRCTLGGVGVLAVLVVLLLVWFWNSRWVMQKSGRPLFWFNCLCLMMKKPQMTRQARDKHTRHNQGIRPFRSNERD